MALWARGNAGCAGQARRSLGEAAVASDVGQTAKFIDAAYP
jgi:hypothetical protein